MTGTRPSDILRQLEGLASTDRELLARFVRERDQAAFKELVTRYGPVVLGVCRRVTAHPQDAEDAFQAVFLILARKAPTIRKPEVIGSWLHGVALRLSRTARRSVLRRRTREIVVSIMPEQPAPATETEMELNPILDEEMAALPSWYRDAIVQCDLRGLSREEAAVALGVPLGTVSSRLTNGRKKLAARLTKRGIALSTAAIPTTLSATQAAIVPNELLVKTCALVADWAAGGAIPKPLAKLTEGGMAVRKTLLLGLLTTAVSVAGFIYATQPAVDSSPLDPPKIPTVTGKLEAAEQPSPDAKPRDKQVVFASTPKMSKAFDLSVHGDLTLRWNAQGTMLAVGGKDLDQGNTKKEINSIEVAALDSDAIKHYCYSPTQLVGFTPDGKNVLTEQREYQFVSGFHKLDVWGETTEKIKRHRPEDDRELVLMRSIALEPTETQGYFFAPDGMTFRTVAVDREPGTKEVRKVTVVEVDASTGKHLKSLVSASAGNYALSADGKRLAVMWQKGGEFTVDVYDVDRTNKLFSYNLTAEVTAPQRFSLTRQAIVASRKGDMPATVMRKLNALVGNEVCTQDEFVKEIAKVLDADEIKKYQEIILNLAKIPKKEYLLQRDKEKIFERVEGKLPQTHGGNPESYVVSPRMVISHAGHRLLIYSGFGIARWYGHGDGVETLEMTGARGKFIILNGETGKPLPALEGLECVRALPGPYAFSFTGRHLALSGINYLPKANQSGGNQFDNAIDLQVLGRQFLTVWDTETGKALKSWNLSAQVAFNPVRPILAVLEPNGDRLTRLGFWDFSAETAEKK